MNNRNSVIHVDQVSKSYHNKAVLRDVSFSVDEGRIFGILGLDNAGKSTLIKILASLVRPDVGHLSVAGTIGYVSEAKTLYNHMNVKELAAFCQGVSRYWEAGKVEQFMRTFSVSSAQKVGSLTPQQRSLFYLALTLAAKPQILLLDEPLAFLDDTSVKLMINYILNYVGDDGGTIILAAGSMNGLAGILDEIAVLQAGRIVYVGEVNQLQELFYKIRIVPTKETNLMVCPEIYRIEPEGRSILISARGNKDHVVRQIGKIEHDFMDVITLSPKDIYLELAGGNFVSE